MNVDGLGTAESTSSRTRRGKPAYLLSYRGDTDIVLQRITAKGYHYATLSSGRRLTSCEVTFLVDQPNTLPIVDTSACFSNHGAIPCHSAKVIVGRHSYLIVGYMDPEKEANANLFDIMSHIAYRGELIVFSIGRNVRLLSRPNGGHLMLQAIRL